MLVAMAIVNTTFRLVGLNSWQHSSSLKGLGEIVVSVKMPVTRSRTERPHGALLQLDIEFRHCTYRIGGRLRIQYASIGGVTVGIPPL